MSSQLAAVLPYAPAIVGVLVIAVTAFMWLTALPRPFTFELPADTKEKAEAVKPPKYKITGPALVTGGAGFLGQHIVDALQDAGVKVVVFDLSRDYKPSKDVVFVQGNLVNREEITKALKDNNIQVVFHVASPDPNSNNKTLFEMVNVIGTVNVLACCKEVGVKTLVYTSSASVTWEGVGVNGIDETTPYPASFRDAYAETKARAEQLVMAAGKASGGQLNTICLRPHSIFGPRDPTLVPTVVKLALNKKQRFIVGDGSNLVDWTYVGNVVHSHMLAAEVSQREGKHCVANGRTYFITNGTPLPFWAFMNYLLLGLGFDASSRWLPYQVVLAIAYVAQFCVSAVNFGIGILNSTLGLRTKPVVMTLSPSRIQISGTAHWYSIENAKRDLGYKPLWTIPEALYLTLRHFAYLRNMKPSQATLENARKGNLMALKLVDDPDNKKGDKGLGKSMTESLDRAMRGANEVFVDEATLPAYTAEEVARHSKIDDLWVIIDDRVYDLTRFVEPHPGGLDIMKNAGGNASVGFHGPQHPSHVFDTLKKFIIGKLAATQ